MDDNLKEFMDDDGKIKLLPLEPKTKVTHSVLSQSSLEPTSLHSMKGWQKYADAVSEMAAVLEFLTKEAEKEQKKKIYETYYDGTSFCYRSDYSVLNLSLEQLTLRLQRVFESPPLLPTSMAGKTEPAYDTHPFDYLSIIFGFYNFLPAFADSGVVDDTALRVCMDVFYYRLREQAMIYISEADWKNLNTAAATRLWYRLCNKFCDKYSCPAGMSQRQHETILKYRSDLNYFNYNGVLKKEDIPYFSSPLVQQVVSSEEKRLRKFTVALDGTLRVLSLIAALCKGVPPPADMTVFMGALRAVLSGKQEAEVLLQLFPVPGSVRVVSSHPTTQDIMGDLQRQVKETKHELEVMKAQMVQQVEMKNKRIRELEEQLALLKPQVQDDRIITNFTTEYLKPLREAGERKRKNGVLPCIVNNGIHFSSGIVYSYDPSEVHNAVMKLEELLGLAETKKDNLLRGKRILDKNILFAISTVLGFYNLFRYLIAAEHMPGNKDAPFSSMLCNLSLSPIRLHPMVDELEAIPWLVEHMPPKRNIPDEPCCVLAQDNSSNYHDQRIAESIIEMEKTKLLRFRNSLYQLLTALTPNRHEDEAQQQETEAAIRVIEVKHHAGSHTYHLELTDLVYLSKPYPFLMTIAPDEEVILEEEET